MVNVELVHQFLQRRAATTPDQVAVVDGRAECSYGELERQANAVAHVLAREGIERGDRVGLLAANSIEYIVSYYGILKSGAVAVALNAAADSVTNQQLLELCQARALICGRRMARRAAEVRRLPHLQVILGWGPEWSECCRSDCGCRLIDRGELVELDVCAPHIELHGMDRAAIIYTSGSTGQPKGATLRHANIVANTNSIVSYLRLTPQDRVMVVLPFHYVYGKSLLNTHVAAGGSVVIENGFLFPQPRWIICSAHAAQDSLEYPARLPFS